jgi:lipoprotein NlpD
MVQRGDTLFGIALDFGHDYRELAAWNGLADAAVIRVGQRLRLTPPEGADQPLVKPLGSRGIVKVDSLPGSAGPAATPEHADAPVPSRGAEEGPALVRTLSEPRAVTVPYSDKAYAQLGGAAARPSIAEAKPESKPESKPEPKPEPKPIGAATPAGLPKETPEPRPDPQRDAKETAVARTGGDEDRVDWVWPARGDLVYRFGESGRLKGVGIGGTSGQPVLAAASGKVVYCGSGLRGYGKLVILKHNDMFLSVYAHNSQLLVKEGEQVKRGQRIAEMGDTDASRVALHFEIRRYGKPVDPVTQLPGDRPS